MSMNHRNVSWFAPPELVKQLDDIADAVGISRSQLITKGVEMFLARQQGHRRRRQRERAGTYDRPQKSPELPR